MRGKYLFAVVAVAVLSSSPISRSVRADTVFSNLGPGDTYNQTALGNEVGSPFFVFDQDSAGGFTVGPNNYTLTTAELGIGHLLHDNTVSVDLYSDAGGLPGASIASTTISGLPDFGTTDNTLTTATFGGAVPLLANTKYWLVAGGNGSTWDAWNWNITGDTDAAFREDGGAWGPTTPAGAFRINGTLDAAAAPTPSVALAGLPLLAGLALSRLRRRNLATSN